MSLGRAGSCAGYVGRLAELRRGLLAWRVAPGGGRESAGEGGDEVAEFVRSLDGERPVKIGIAYESGKCGRLPRETHDMPLDAVVTETSIY